MAEIIKLDAAQARAYLPDFIELIIDTVASGASIGYWHPMRREVAEEFWLNIFEQVEKGHRILLAALEDSKVIGTVQLEPNRKQNGAHRGEVQKLMVLQSARVKGIGRALMEAVEEEARRYGLKMIMLDTLEGHVAEQMYPKLGFNRVGAMPSFTIEADGTYGTTVFFYKMLDAS
jgi:GNAT superfamily N-acetyltransferase